MAHAPSRRRVALVVLVPPDVAPWFRDQRPRCPDARRLWGRKHRRGRAACTRCMISMTSTTSWGMRRARQRGWDRVPISSGPRRRPAGGSWRPTPDGNLRHCSWLPWNDRLGCWACARLLLRVRTSPCGAISCVHQEGLPVPHARVHFQAPKTHAMSTPTKISHGDPFSQFSEAAGRQSKGGYEVRHGC